jgi:hypothetical protein
MYNSAYPTPTPYFIKPNIYRNKSFWLLYPCPVPWNSNTHHRHICVTKFGLISPTAPWIVSFLWTFYDGIIVLRSSVHLLSKWEFVSNCTVLRDICQVCYYELKFLFLKRSCCMNAVCEESGTQLEFMSNGNYSDQRVLGIFPCILSFSRLCVKWRSVIYVGSSTSKNHTTRLLRNVIGHVKWVLIPCTCKRIVRICVTLVL